MNRLSDPRRGAVLCDSCGRLVRGTIYHAGFADVLPLFCSACEAVLLIELDHDALADLRRWAEQHGSSPGLAPAPLWEQLATRFRPCACGGRFARENPPRCPRCRGRLWGHEPARRERDGSPVFVPGPCYDGRAHARAHGP